jgi:RNA recognition motif-containing protein
MNIYVGNLDFRIDENDLRGVFEQYGAVKEIKIIIDKATGRSKGFAFVVMENDKAAVQAIEELNGATFENRKMVVNEAKPRKQY